MRSSAHEGGEGAVTTGDGWFLIVFGGCVVLIARRYGRALGNGIEGARTPEQRRADVIRHTWAARVCGVGSIAYGCWLLWR